MKRSRPFMTDTHRYVEASFPHFYFSIFFSPSHSLACAQYSLSLTSSMSSESVDVCVCSFALCYINAHKWLYLSLLFTLALRLILIAAYNIRGSVGRSICMCIVYVVSVHLVVCECVIAPLQNS